MSNREFTATRTMLANAMATAGAELLEYMGASSALAAIPNTEPQQYVVAGTLAMIAKALPAAPVPPLTAPAPLTDKFEGIRAALGQAYRYTSTSPRAQGDINAALDLLDEIESAQAAPAPQQSKLTEAQISAAGRALADRSADSCGVNRDDNWMIYGSEFIEDARIAFSAAAKAAPAAPVQTAEPQKIEAWCERDGDEWVIYAAESPTGQYIAKHMKERHGVDVFALPPQVAAPVQAEQAQAEPVAWALKLKNGGLEFNGSYGMFKTKASADDAHRCHLGSVAVVPLYAAPALPTQAAAVRAAYEQAATCADTFVSEQMDPERMECGRDIAKAIRTIKADVLTATKEGDSK